jgi:hypothetical protein
VQQFTKSLGSFSWAMSLFGIQQMINALGATSGDRNAAKAVDALDDITRVSLEYCGESARDTFAIGDKMQRSVIDLMFRFIPLAGEDRLGGGCSCGQPADTKRSTTVGLYRASGTS